MKEQEEKKASFFDKLGFFASQMIKGKQDEKARKRVLQIGDFENAKFDETIFWENTLPNPNITEYTFYYIATDQRISDWTKHTEVKKIQFSLYGYKSYNTSGFLYKIRGAMLILMMATFALIGGY